jgi:hypothetical protein
MFQKSKNTVASAVSCSAVERETISKNRACPKSQRVGFNFTLHAIIF